MPVNRGAVATIRTVKPYGSVFGRPLKFGGPGGGSGPLKEPTDAGKRDLRSLRSSWATVPSKALVCTVPSHHDDGTTLKSPGGRSVVSPLLGSDPGATWTWHEYGVPRAKTCAVIAAVGWVGSTWAYQFGDVISVSGGMFPAAAASTALAMLARP